MQMRSVQYGMVKIPYSVEINSKLKGHYITVDRNSGVVLKGKTVSNAAADKLVLSKGGWIVKKLQLVKADNDDKIVTGSRLKYLGKSYYVKLLVDERLDSVKVEFNHSVFTISKPGKNTSQTETQNAIQLFYRVKAIEKITPRLKQLSFKTGLNYHGVQFRAMRKRWASCTGKNRIIVNTEVVKLPFSLIDYVLVHELCHTKVKDHSKRFWSEVGKWERGWKKLDQLVGAYPLS
jgi:predicted metal-dependent hydrolase